jgi:hypothetical protein
MIARYQLKPKATNMNIDTGMTNIIDFSTLPDEVEFTSTPCGRLSESGVKWRG